jgi:hypothetical protein
MLNNFVAFILSHGRPDNVRTYDTLKKHGYTGKIIILIDNEDKTSNQYIQKYGEKNVIIFDKKMQSKKFDQADNFDDRRSIVYARNVCFDVAKYLQIKYFIQLDDDYTSFRYRYFQDTYITKGTVKNLDVYFKILLDFYKSTSISSVAIAQGGDFIGGESCGMLSNYENMSRKAMNSFICSTERPFKFVGRINEDVNTYVYKGSLGLLQLTIPYIALEQLPTQSNDSGMADIYNALGTYVKSFYSVIFHPSSVKVKLMGFKNNRMHHSIKWTNSVPKILDEKYKK